MTLKDKKISVLVKIARELNKNNILWCLGASAMLYLRGYVSDFDDIDIMTSENDVEKIKLILGAYGTLAEDSPNSKYKTKVFLEYNIEDIDVDVMAGLVIVSDNIEHYFPLKEEDSDVILVDGVDIYIASIESWLKYYTLMKRLDKVEIINKGKNHEG